MFSEYGEFILDLEGDHKRFDSYLKIIISVNTK